MKRRSTTRHNKNKNHSFPRVTFSLIVLGAVIFAAYTLIANGTGPLSSIFAKTITINELKTVCTRRIDGKKVCTQYESVPNPTNSLLVTKTTTQILKDNAVEYKYVATTTTNPTTGEKAIIETRANIGKDGEEKLLSKATTIIDKKRKVTKDEREGDMTLGVAPVDSSPIVPPIITGSNDEACDEKGANCYVWNGTSWVKSTEIITSPQANTGSYSGTGGSSCEGSSASVQIPDGTWAASGKNMGEGQESQRECVQCQNGKWKESAACHIKYAEDPSHVILPPQAGNEYTTGTKTKEGIGYDPNYKENCYDSSGVVSPTGTQKGSTRCFDGKWVKEPDFDTLMRESCVGTYDAANNKCNPKEGTAGPETPEKEAPVPSTIFETQSECAKNLPAGEACSRIIGGVDGGAYKRFTINVEIPRADVPPKCGTYYKWDGKYCVPGISSPDRFEEAQTRSKNKCLYVNGDETKKTGMQYDMETGLCISGKETLTPARTFDCKAGQTGNTYIECTPSTTKAGSPTATYHFCSAKPNDKDQEYVQGKGCVDVGDIKYTTGVFTGGETSEKADGSDCKYGRISGSSICAYSTTKTDSSSSAPVVVTPAVAQVSLIKATCSVKSHNYSCDVSKKTCGDGAILYNIVKHNCSQEVQCIESASCMSQKVGNILTGQECPDGNDNSCVSGSCKSTNTLLKGKVGFITYHVNVNMCVDKIYKKNVEPKSLAGGQLTTNTESCMYGFEDVNMLDTYKCKYKSAILTLSLPPENSKKIPPTAPTGSAAVTDVVTKPSQCGSGKFAFNSDGSFTCMPKEFACKGEVGNPKASEEYVYCDIYGGSHNYAAECQDNPTWIPDGDGHCKPKGEVMNPAVTPPTIVSPIVTELESSVTDNQLVVQMQNAESWANETFGSRKCEEDASITMRRVGCGPTTANNIVKNTIGTSDTPIQTARNFNPDTIKCTGTGTDAVAATLAQDYGFDSYDFNNETANYFDLKTQPLSDISKYTDKGAKLIIGASFIVPVQGTVAHIAYIDNCSKTGQNTICQIIDSAFSNGQVMDCIVNDSLKKMDCTDPNEIADDYVINFDSTTSPLVDPNIAIAYPPGV